ncbi:MAG: hypothetical protein GY679_05375 [Mycoplasma sp.]|nr:hypothetical protein [Mycoplasma sp.]
MEFDDFKNSGMKMNFKLLSDKQDNFHANELMKKENGKWVFKKAHDIIDNNLDGLGKVTLNITLSDTIKEKIKGKYNLANKKYKKNHIYLELTSFNSYLDKEFFEDLTTSDDEAKKLAKKLEDLEKNSSFRLAFNLVLPKWMETEFGDTNWDIDLDHSDNRKDKRGYVVEQIEQVSVENNSNIKIDKLYIDLGLKSFDPTNLPKGLKRLNLTWNKLTSFDPTNLPKGIEFLDLLNNNLTKETKEKITKWWKANGKNENNLHL